MQKGPVAEEEIRRLRQVGSINDSTLVWREGMAGWLPLREAQPDWAAQLPEATSPALPSSPEAASAHRCVACLNEAEVGDLVMLQGRPYCQRCKGLALQSLRERGQLPVSAEGPQGVRGWLLFFCVSLTILQPAIFLLATLGAFLALSQQPGGIPPLVYWDTAIMTVFVATSAVVGGRIWAGHERGRTLALRLLYARLPYLLVCNALGLFFFVAPSAFSNPTFIGAIIGNVLREVLYFAIWVAYFKRSKRVRNTYGPE